MKLFLQILFLLTTCLTNQTNATPVFVKVVLPSSKVVFSKEENVKKENVLKIGVENFAKSSIEDKNQFSKTSKREVWASVAYSERNVKRVNGAGRFIAKFGNELKTYLNAIVNKPIGKSYSGKMFRYIPEQYSDAKLIVQTSTSDAANRFRTGLYLSETKAGNVIEVSSYGGTSGKQLYEFTDVQVNNLLDLTDANTIEILGTTFDQMKLTGVAKPYEFTQEVAIWAKNNGYSGVKFYGSQGGNTVYTNFVLFEQPTVNSAIKGPINPISW